MRRAVKRASNCLRIAARLKHRQAIDRRDRAGFVLDDEAGQPVVDDLGDRAAVIGDHRRAAGHRLDHHQAERLRPVDRHQQPDRAAQEFRLLGIADLADEVDQRIVLDQRANEFVVIFLVGAIDLGGDLERNAAAGGDLDRAVDALFRRDAAEHGQIAGRHRLRRQQLFPAGRDGWCAPSWPAAPDAAGRSRSKSPESTRRS